MIRVRVSAQRVIMLAVVYVESRDGTVLSRMAVELVAAAQANWSGRTSLIASNDTGHESIVQTP